jgi:hypothetical protein
LPSNRPAGNVTKTAELPGLERSNLYREMKTLGIGPKEQSTLPDPWRAVPLNDAPCTGRPL